MSAGPDLVQPEDEVDVAGVVRGPRHPGELGRGRILHNDRPSRLGDRPHPHVGIASRAREHDADGTPPG